MHRMYQFSLRLTRKKMAQSAGVLEDTNGTSVVGKTPPTNVVDLTQNNLIVRLQ